MSQPKIVKLSHSILSAWSGKHFEQAVAQYLGKPFPATPQMELGKLKHELWEKEVIEHKRIPLELGGEPLQNPVAETKYEKLIPLGDKYAILLRGVVDCSDGNTIYEWKCGATTAGQYVGSTQLPYYKLFLPEVTLGVYRCYNPYTETYSTGIRFLNQEDADYALEHIITFGSELIEYLESQRMITSYKPEIYVPQLELLTK